MSESMPTVSVARQARTVGTPRTSSLSCRRLHITPALCSRPRALFGSKAPTTTETIIAGNYAKITERGFGLHQRFVSAYRL